MLNRDRMHERHVASVTTATLPVVSRGTEMTSASREMSPTTGWNDPVAELLDHGSPKLELGAVLQGAAVVLRSRRGSLGLRQAVDGHDR